METQIYSINSNISWKLLKEAVVAVNLDDGNYFTFNFTASLIWQAVDEGKSVYEIEQFIKEQFPDTSAQEIENDIQAIFHFWETEKLVKIKN